MMRLVKLSTNSAWAFLFGDEGLTRMGSHPMTFGTRDEAVAAARSMGLIVDSAGTVSVPEPTHK